MNESELLQIILPAFHADKTVAVGVGDDCALLQFGNKYLLAAADQVIGNIHYVPDTPPEAVAAKLLKRNLSDIAAMGGIARYALCTLAVAGRCDDLHDGKRRCRSSIQSFPWSRLIRPCIYEIPEKS